MPSKSRDSQLFSFPSGQTVPCTPPTPTSSSLDRSPPSVDLSQVDDGITIYVALDDGWHNAASPATAVRRWNAIHFQIRVEIWAKFWQVPWEGLRALFRSARCKIREKLEPPLIISIDL